MKYMVMAIAVLFLSGCGPSGEEHDRLKSEVDRLEGEVAGLYREVGGLSEENVVLRKKVALYEVADKFRKIEEKVKSEKKKGYYNYELSELERAVLFGDAENLASLFLRSNNKNRDEEWYGDSYTIPVRLRVIKSGEDLYDSSTS